jgi:integrase
VATSAGGGRQRGHGEGSIYQRSDGRWTGSATLGYGPSGRRRKVAYGRTQAEVRDKLRALLTQIETGLPLPDDQLTVGEPLARYLRDVVPGRVAASTADNYATLARIHLVPALGRTKLAKLTPMDMQGTSAPPGATSSASNEVVGVCAVVRRRFATAAP